MRFLMLVIAAFVTFSLLGESSIYAATEAKITVKIVDEGGNPVEGANVIVGFESTKYDKNHIDINGFSDASGLFQASGYSLDFASSFAEKNGYYSNYNKYFFREGVKSGCWQPWDPTVELLLRKIEKPVTMYHRDTQMDKPRLNIPVTGKEIGFDLMKYEWLPPYGRGTTADFKIKLEKSYKNPRDYLGRLTITFSNKFDGIQRYKEGRQYGSSFKLPRYAPQDGYKDKLVLEWSRSPGKPKIRGDYKDDNYFFRVRSEVDDGKLVRAMYGKIVGPIDISRFTESNVGLNFVYYLNPDYTRNMEMGDNLFGR
ncbi:carboxypeptidase regulatory-like domain-containing protein [bacterium]|nr:carboxypeptidase regulatory-like domain-containing protein [bacterium]